jgi:hypothetical protein
MKKTSEALTQTQNQTAVRQELLEAGRIKVRPIEKGSAPAPKQQEQQRQETTGS